MIDPKNYINNQPLCNKHNCLFNNFIYCEHDLHLITPNSKNCIHLKKGTNPDLLYYVKSYNEIKNILKDLKC